MSLEAIAVIAFFIALYVFFYYRGKQKFARNVEAGQDFCQANHNKPNVFTTSSGLQYQVLKPAKPRDQFMLAKADSTICVHYQGSLLDGTVFDASQDKPVTFNLDQMMPGWQEGIQLMQIGEKTRFFIPSHLAYGDKKVGPIEPGSLLIFDVKLVDFY